ncbi:MAG: hypothetical protein M0Z84_01585 [Gammaproteobacteria bacterium]|nr:hypothetical protein [Gammaproteobacteria bacterium]
MKRARGFFILLACLALFPRAACFGDCGLIVIANPRVPATSLSVPDLAAIYLRRVTVWSDGQPIVPVNQGTGSVIRKRFSVILFKEPPVALDDYWNRMHFQGQNPPLVLGSDRDVVIFVNKVPGAIGYVRKGTPIESAKILGRLP